MIHRSFFALLLAFLVAGCAAMEARHEPLVRPNAPLGASIMAESVVELRGASFAGRAAISARGPEDITIEVMAPFGQLAALIAADSSGVTISSGDGVDRYRYDDPGYPFSFTSEELYWFLIGAPGQRPGFSSHEDPGRAITLRRGGDEEGLIVRLADFREASGYVVPFEIGITGARGDISIRHGSVAVEGPR